ncbi:hypothetical protein COCVIDRAFT_34451 [Bipolaris victoriae FI3]|uniref:Uncharacterized protein n=2 Tax=Bipolaris TaxID=33194 RepID=W6YH39_COCC2|nr:uncharacterized protein COCCADRAFT_86678 [Bipolaris zeicola 26-R-13]XP_014560505.1 hypothetical protein COCVIDRAFT_34451 [Bipolaris victoriae FI3]EUC37028.1 hypothetical protein COCCADRAFT_86678 [Bipolaris zeicola 26-R-13]
MDWRLLDYAKEAEETANGLLSFEGEIPQYRKDIRGYMAELYAISHALRELDDALRSINYRGYATYIIKDLEICLPTLGHTLDDVQDIFSKSKRSRHAAPGAFPGTPPYAIIWEDALADFKTQGMSLPQRFEAVRMYLQGMHDTLKGEENDVELANYKVSLSKLLKKQKPIESYFSKLSVQGSGRSGAKTPKPSSPRVSRPKIHSHPTYPVAAYNYSHPSSPLPHRAHIAPTWGGIGDIPFVPPPVPEIPQSPTHSSASSQAYSSQSTDSEPAAHWAMKIFDGRHGSTPFQTLGEATECFGRNEPRVIGMLQDDGFEKVLELPFEATNVWVRMYCRAEDNRARILFLSMDSEGRRMRYQIPITALALRRAGSCLLLCRANRRDGQLDLWARLRFPLYERMVLFYCTAIAMKRQDQTAVAEGLVDFFEPESIMFSGETTDSRYLHAFRIYYDEDAGCVRFEATARRGPMNTIPIWTAFVTQYVGRRDWMKRVSPDTIQFEKLHPYVFCDSYRLPKGPTGKYRLTFTTPEDAKQFRESFYRIGMA